MALEFSPLPPPNAFASEKDASLPKVPKGMQAYEIKPGESFGSIAKAFNLTVKKLLEGNPQIEDPNVIRAGDVIWVPRNREKSVAARGVPTSRDPLATARSHLTDACWDRLEAVSKELNIRTEDLLTCILKETWGTFNPAIQSTGGATGLIQFTTPALEDRERKWNKAGYTKESLLAMSAAEQLTPVRDYLKYRLGKTRPLGASDIYMAILWPAAVGKPEDTVLMAKGSENKNIARAYEANVGLDINQDFKITKSEASARVLEYRSMARVLISERKMAQQNRR